MITRNRMMIVLAIAGVAVATFAFTAPANAAIVVDATDFWNSTGSPVTGNFDASASDKLVVIVTGEHGFNQTANGDGGLVTYDGVELTQMVDRNAIKADTDNGILVDDTWNDIWYLDNPSTSTGLISAAATTRGSVTVFALSGTSPGVGNTVIGPRDSISADLTTSAGSIVIASYGMGGDGNTAILSQVTTDAPLIEVSRQENGSNWDGHVTGYALGVAAGSAT